ncbi:MAG: SUMF1/EgtB/PvdO family nonheme iron enzyme, partial [Alphaproteobacteria bacterium]
HLDLSGNVWECCWDWYKDKGMVVIRGGGWSNYAKYIETLYITFKGPEGRSNSVGFRLARDI